jgi:UDP-N-acetyl-D-mannosaminuronate dehydrogenase
MRGASGGDNKVATTGHQCVIAPSGSRIDNMVHRAKSMLPLPHRTAVLEQAIQCHTTRSLMKENAIDVQKGLALRKRFHLVLFPELVKQGHCHDKLINLPKTACCALLNSTHIQTT